MPLQLELLLAGVAMLAGAMPAEGVQSPFLCPPLPIDMAATPAAVLGTSLEPLGLQGQVAAWLPEAGVTVR